MTKDGVSDSSILAETEKVLAFLPVFQKPGFLAGKDVCNQGEFPYFSYSPDVIAFVRACEQADLIRPSGWDSWQAEAEEYYHDPAKLESANLETIIRLLTLHVRKERFCEGHLAQMIRSGHIGAILKRLKKIRESWE